jgi:hypothetical protein
MERKRTEVQASKQPERDVPHGGKETTKYRNLHHCIWFVVLVCVVDHVWMKHWESKILNSHIPHCPTSCKLLL